MQLQMNRSRHKDRFSPPPHPPWKGSHPRAAFHLFRGRAATKFSSATVRQCGITAMTEQYRSSLKGRRTERRCNDSSAVRQCDRGAPLPQKNTSSSARMCPWHPHDLPISKKRAGGRGPRQRGCGPFGERALHKHSALPIREGLSYRPVYNPRDFLLFIFVNTFLNSSQDSSPFLFSTLPAWEPEVRFKPHA
jgi:hypothetical protein